MHWNHILFHLPSCQDKPTLPSSVNTWDGLLLPTQPRGSCWCACCCQLMCHWKEVLLFHWETNCIGRRVKAEATCLRACRRRGPSLQLRDSNNAILMKVTAQWLGASSTTVKMAAQQEQRYQRNDGNGNITTINVLKLFLHICLIQMREAVWSGCQPQPWRNDIILNPQVTQNPNIWAKYKSKTV